LRRDSETRHTVPIPGAASLSANGIAETPNLYGARLHLTEAQIAELERVGSRRRLEPTGRRPIDRAMRTSFINRDASPAMRARSTRSGPERVVATFDDYASAEKAVDMLSDRGFPVERTAIVGRDLQYVEHVTGRMTTAKAALNGAVSGAVVGLFVGWFFGLFNWFNPVIASAWLALWGVLIGAALGAIMGAIGHSVLGGRRDFASVGAVQAQHFDLVVEEPVADEAARLLQELPTDVS